MQFVFAGGDPLVKELISERVQKFNIQYPEYQINEISSGSGPYLDFVKTQDAIGEFPDILDSRNTAIWVEGDKLAELPDSVVALLNAPPTYNDRYYVAPLSLPLPSLGIFYNKALFDDLNLEEPTTYGEFEVLCDTIAENGLVPMVQGGKDIWHIGFLWSHLWNEMVTRENPNWIVDKHAGRVSFTDENVQMMIKKYASLYEKNYIDKDWLVTPDNQLVSYLLTEKAAMFFSGSWMINQVAEADPSFELGWFPLPDQSGDISLVYATSLAGFALSKEASLNPDKVACFEAFTQFWYADENYIPYIEAVVAIPATNTNEPIEYKSSFPDEFNLALSQAVFESPEWSTFRDENTLPSGFRNITYTSFQNMIKNGRSSEELGVLLDQYWTIKLQ